MIVVIIQITRDGQIIETYVDWETYLNDDDVSHYCD